MKKIAQIGLLLFTVNAFSHVSINTTSTNKQLDIHSGDPTMSSISDEIIIPKNDSFLRINTKILQDKMMVYLIAVSPVNQSDYIIDTNARIKPARARILMTQ